jgi:arylsulfatase A-like enzyme
MNRPNILLISIDSLRADAVSTVGSEMNTTPFLDSLADKSTLFTSAFSNGIWTAPSHASIFTGLYPTEHGVYDSGAISQGNVSLGDHPTLGSRLKATGYNTEAFYRLGWLGSGDILRGFESDTEEREEDYSNFGSILDSLSSKLPVGRTLLRAIYRGTFRGHMADENVLNPATGRLQSTSSPFCFFVHLNDAHWPYSPVKPFYNQFTDRSFPSLFWNRAYVQTRMYSLEDNNWTPSPKQIDVMKDLYLGAVRQVDHHLESLITAIPDDVLDKTVVVIFGDHGEAFGEGGKLGHNDIIPEVAHVPLLIKDPTGQLEKGRIDTPVQLADIYQTIGSLAGVSVPETNTNDLTETLPKSPVFTHTGQNPRDDSLMKKYGIWRTSSDYLVWNAETDTIDRYGNTDGLKTELDRHIEELNHVPPTGNKALDSDAKDRLRELGYLQ